MDADRPITEYEYYYDIDWFRPEFLASLVQYDDLWYRYSSSGKGLHIVSMEPLKEDLNIFDSTYTIDYRFDGNCFFDNKGDKWASEYWFNPRYRLYRIFPSKIIAVVVVNSELREFGDYRSAKSYMVNALRTFNPVTYSLHSAVVNKLHTEPRSLSSYSSGPYYRSKKFKNIRRFNYNWDLLRRTAALKRQEFSILL